MISLVLVTHPGYLHLLPEVLKAAGQAGGISQRILVLDSVPDDVQAPGWEIVRVSCGSPNPARNAGLDRARHSWVMFWDGDNIMPSGYPAKLAEIAWTAAQHVGVIYPDIEYVDSPQQHSHVWQAPEWDFWTMRERTYIDTSSLWRADALLQVGGFRGGQPILDDWDLALRITDAGWTGLHAQVATRITQHPDRRSGRSQNLPGALWTSWSLAVITLWGGTSPSFRKVGAWLESADLPPMTRLYWADNSDSQGLALWLRNLSGRLISTGRVRGVDLQHVPEQYVPVPGEAYLHPGRHRHVAGLYNRVLGRVRESLVLFLEDDCVPPLDGLRKLHQALPVNSDLAGIGGVYEARNTPGHACVSLSPSAWQAPQMQHIPASVLGCGMLGGGFTLYKTSALRQCLPFFVVSRASEMLGWDATLGRALHQKGYKLNLHGDVRVAHEFDDTRP